MRNTFLILLPLWTLTVYADATAVDLGAADPFAVLAGSTITNTGTSTIDGDLGVSPGTAITGFPPGVETDGTVFNGGAAAMQAESDFTTAYNFAAAEACGGVLTGQNLGGMTLVPGVYCFTSSAQLTGTLTLNAENNPYSVFVFQIGSTLTTASNSSVVFTNDGQGDGVFWQVGSSATLGTDTAFEGNILANASITLTTGANIQCGRALAGSGAVTLDTNNVSIDSAGCGASVGSMGGSQVPEPGSFWLLSLGLVLSILTFGRRRIGHHLAPNSAIMRRMVSKAGLGV